eukprot:gene6475-6331_t
MSISHYIKDIGRGKDGARALGRAQAADLLGQILDQQVSDLELGAFCIAMRIKGETPEEMAGFLDATHARLNKVVTGQAPTVVLPSYNGARKLPVLTPLLALLLAREGVAVVMHGTATEDKRVSSQAVLAELGISASGASPQVKAGEVAFVPTGVLHAGLERLLAVRRVVGLRNPGHSLVKHMNPCEGPALVVSSYTHPEYLQSMSATFALTAQHALLLRGTEGESVADARRTPAMDVFKDGQTRRVQAPQEGPLSQLPELPSTDAAATALYIEHVMQNLLPLLTLKAVKAIASATVLLVDDLVNDAVLAHASPSARIVHVGKRGGCKSTPQAFIDKLMITAVHEGEHVVRLKGGDPFIFGRGGEEVEHLREAGIDVQVVNGITSGLAGMSSLGAPLTHREHAHGVVFATGHAKPGDAGPDWALLANTAHQAKLTLVIYMGVSSL